MLQPRRPISATIWTAFFDCTNVRSSTEYIHKRKPFLEPYKDLEDPRFNWLKIEFLGYFEAWEVSIESRTEASKTEKSKMFISRQTMDGLKITCYSLIELVKFLLQNGMPEVKTESVNQDPLEKFFGYERKIGRRNDNPDIYTFGYNANTIRIQRHISCTSGNTSGRKDKKNCWSDVTDDPVPKRKK